MPQEICWYIINGCLRSAYLCAFGLGVPHTTTYALTDDTQLQLREHTRHLDKGVCHRVQFPRRTIHIDAADDGKPQPLVLHMQLRINLPEGFFSGASIDCSHFALYTDSRLRGQRQGIRGIAG